MELPRTRVGGPASGMDHASRTANRHRACARTGTRVGEGEPMKPSTSLPVLVVDDNEDVREAVSEVLRTEGFGVASAANGKEALTYLQTHDAALVFLDLERIAH